MSKEVILNLSTHEDPRRNPRDYIGSESEIPVTRFRQEAHYLFNRFPDQQIAILIEAGDCTHQQSEQITQQVAKGVLPSHAMLNAVGLSQSAISESEFQKDPTIKDNSDDLSATFKEIDVLYRRFGNRLVLLTESHPPEKSTEIKQVMGQALEQLDESKECLRVGDLDQATELFKFGTRTYARYSAQRDRAIVEKVRRTLYRDDIAAVLIRFGALHSPIGHDLQRTSSNDVRLVYEHLDTKSGIIFPPQDVCARSIYFKGHESLSRYDWMFYTVANALWARLYETFPNSAQIFYKKLKLIFPDIVSILQFVEKVKIANRQVTTSPDYQPSSMPLQDL